MAVQTSVAARPDAGKPGQVADCAYNDIVSGVAGEALSFGQVVCDKGAGWVLVSAAEDLEQFAWGVAIINKILPTEAGYSAGDDIQVLKRGRAFVAADVSMALGDAVLVDETTAQFTDTPATGVTAELTGARVTLAGSIPVIDISGQDATVSA